MNRFYNPGQRRLHNGRFFLDGPVGIFSGVSDFKHDPGPGHPAADERDHGESGISSVALGTFSVLFPVLQFAALSTTRAFQKGAGLVRHWRYAVLDNLVIELGIVIALFLPGNLLQANISVVFF